jgi:hypothetical protein
MRSTCRRAVPGGISERVQVQFRPWLVAYLLTSLARLVSLIQADPLLPSIGNTTGRRTTPGHQISNEELGAGIMGLGGEHQAPHQIW